MAQAVPVQDALDGVVHAVAHDAEGDAFRAAVPHELHEPAGDGDRIQKGVQPLQRSLDERDLPLHALAGRDGSPHPFVLDGFPGWAGEPFEDRVGHVERRDCAVEITDDGIRPRREIRQLEHVLLLREGLISMHVETPGCFPQTSKQRATVRKSGECHCSPYDCKKRREAAKTAGIEREQHKMKETGYKKWSLLQEMVLDPAQRLRYAGAHNMR